MSTANLQLIDDIYIPAVIAHQYWGEKKLPCGNFTSLNETHNEKSNICNSTPAHFQIVNNDFSAALTHLNKFNYIASNGKYITDDDEIPETNKLDDNVVRAGAKNNNVKWNEDSFLETTFTSNIFNIGVNSNEIYIKGNDTGKQLYHAFKNTCPQGHVLTGLDNKITLKNYLGHLSKDDDREYVRWTFNSPTTIDVNYNANCMKLKKSYPTDTVTLTPDEFNTKILNTYSVQGAIQSIERDESDPNSKIIVKYYKINDIEKNLNNNYLTIPNNYTLKTIGTDGKYTDKNGRNSNDFQQKIDPIFNISDFNIKCNDGAALAGYKYINNKVYPICVTFDNTDPSGGNNNDDDKSDDGSNNGSNGGNNGGNDDGKGNGDDDGKGNGDDNGKGNGGNNGDDDGKGNNDDDPKTTEESFWTSTTAIIIYVCIGILFLIFIIFIIGFVTMSGGGGDYQGGVVYV